MRKYTEVPTTKIVNTDVICDRCGRSVDDVSFNSMSWVQFEIDPSEESEILVAADICYDCFEDIGDELCKIAKRLRELIPKGSFRSRTMLEWEPTGLHAD